MNTKSTSSQQGTQADTLRRLGWNEHFAQAAASMNINSGSIARVLSARRGQFVVGNGQAEWTCTPSGKLRHHAHMDYPVTGDWVVVRDGVIEQVLRRRNLLRRGEAGTRGGRETVAREQPMGTNIDTVFIVCGLDRDYNLRRIERYLALVYNCGINPVVVLTKADLHEDPEAFAEEVESVAFGVPVTLTSMTDEGSISALHSFLRQGQTAAMIGSSGAGKSTLVNLLCGSEVQATSHVSQSLGKGRHTTTARELILLPHGGLLMDNPGIREIAFADDEGGVQAAFPDIEELAAQCRFADCTHEHEPGCAVRRAAETGTLAPDRLTSYHKMRREMHYAAERTEKTADRVEKERWRDVAMEIKRMKKRGR